MEGDGDVDDGGGCSGGNGIARVNDGDDNDSDDNGNDVVDDVCSVNEVCHCIVVCSI